MIQDFLISAWPWMAIGLIAAIVLSSTVVRRKGEENSPAAIGRQKMVAFFIASALAFVTSLVMHLTEGHDATVWASIGSMMLCLGGAQSFRNRRLSDSDKE